MLCFNIVLCKQPHQTGLEGRKHIFVTVSHRSQMEVTTIPITTKSWKTGTTRGRKPKAAADAAAAAVDLIRCSSCSCKKLPSKFEAGQSGLALVFKCLLFLNFRSSSIWPTRLHNSLLSHHKPTLVLLCHRESHLHRLSPQKAQTVFAAHGGTEQPQGEVR